jgi:predicted nucleotidyltransferase
MDLNDKIKRAVAILKKYGTKEIFLFGSAATGELTVNSDLDIAIRGLPNSQYFKAGGELMLKLNMAIDLIDLDEDTPFVRYLTKKGGLVSI